MTAKDIKYVLVETVLNDKEKPISELVKTCKIGLLKGVQYKTVNDPEKEEPFLLLKDKDDSLITVNLNFYNILSIEKFNDLYKTMTYFRASEEEQNQALSKVLDTIKIFQDMDQVLGSNKDLIDTSKYSSVPAKFKTGDGSGISVQSGSNSAAKGSSIYTQTNPTTSRTTTSSWNTPKKPTVIKRKSKVDKALLDTMESKLAEIMKSDYKANLPKIALDPAGVVETGKYDDEDEYYAAYFSG